MNGLEQSDAEVTELMNRLWETARELPEESNSLRRLQDNHKFAAMSHNDGWLELQNIAGDANEAAWVDGVGVSVAFLLAMQADLVRDFRKSRAAATIAVRQLLEETHRAYERGSVLAAFVLMRAALERIADFCENIRVVENSLERLPSAIEDDQLEEFLAELRRVVLKKGVSKTRFDFRNAESITPSAWRSDFSFKELKKTAKENRIDEYVQLPDKYDQRASNVLSAIQNLDRVVDGVWVSYALLSEFGHPNVAGIWALSQHRGFSEPGSDLFPSDQILWVEERLGFNPKEFLTNSELRGPRNGTIETVLDSLVHFTKRLEHSATVENRIIEAVQNRLWTMRDNLSAVWRPTAPCVCESGLQAKECCLRDRGRNDPCGCGSGKKLKYCCGG